MRSEVNTGQPRGITKPKTKAQKLRDACIDLVRADEEIDYWTKKKQDAEREIENVEAEGRKEVYKGKLTEIGCEGTIKKGGS